MTGFCAKSSGEEAVMHDGWIVAPRRFVPAPRQNTIRLCHDDGRYAELSWSGEEIDITGNLPVSDAAKIFFDHVGCLLKAS